MEEIGFWSLLVSTLGPQGLIIVGGLLAIVLLALCNKIARDQIVSMFKVLFSPASSNNKDDE